MNLKTFMRNLNSKILKIFLIFPTILIPTYNIAVLSNEISNKQSEQINIRLSKINKYPVINQIPDIQTSLYLLGPGDKLKINFFDVPELSDEFEILNDGTIQIPYAGSINVNNLTIEQSREKIRDSLKNELIRPDLELKLLEKRPVKISLIGELERPGLYTLSQNENSNTKGGPKLLINGLPTVVDAIQKAGGITQDSDLSKVFISRRLPGQNNKYKTATLNLLNLIIEGDQTQNPHLFDGDIIKINKIDNLSKNSLEIASANFAPQSININIIGEVNNPGQLEVSARTLLNQAILLAGGPKYWRSSKGNVELIRVNRNGTITRKKISINLSNGLSKDENPPLKDGDTIFVRRNILAKGTDSLGGITNPIRDIVTTWTLFKLIGD